MELDEIKKAILNGPLFLKAFRFVFYETEVGHDEGDTDSEFEIRIEKDKTCFEVYGINDKYINNNFEIGNDRIIFYKDEDKVEIVFEWRYSKNTENEPTSLDIFFRGKEISVLQFWFMVGENNNAHIRTISFDVSRYDVI